MNVCSDDGPIVIFRDAWREKIEVEGSKAVGPEWIDHCRARESAERAAAKHATSVEARRIHQELAVAYARAQRRHGR